MPDSVTLTIVKPDAFATNKAGKIIAHLEAQGFRVRAARVMHLTTAQAEEFYGVHRERPFFGELVEFITGGPLVALVAEGPRAVEASRGLIGATDPVKSAPGSIRGDFALEIGENLVHGSDSPDSAVREIELWFPGR